MRPTRRRTKPVLGVLCLELRVSTLEACCHLQAGQVIQVNGTAQKQGAGAAIFDDIQFHFKRTSEQSVCLELKAGSMGKIFHEKLSHIWHCVMSGQRREENIDKTDRQPHEVNHKPLCSDVTSDVTSSSYDEDQVQSSVDHNTGSHAPDDHDVKQEVTFEGQEVTFEGQDEIDIADTDRTTERDQINICLGEVSHNEENTPGDSNNSDDIDPPKAVSSQVKSDKVLEAMEFSCRFCQKSFHRSKHPRKALSAHETRVCRKNPGSNVNLTVKHSKSDIYPFACGYCPEAFKTDTGLSQHQNRIHDKRVTDGEVDVSTLGMTICNICGKHCLSKRAFRLHRTLQHGLSEPRETVPQTVNPVCPYCHEVFHTKITHRQHVRFKCSKNPNAVKCSYCNICLRPFPSDQLEAHKAKKHKEIIPKVCEICGSSFTSRNGLYIHKRRVHNSRPPEWHCQPCNRSFQFKFLLDKHLTKHSDERKIQCSVCGKLFKHRDQEIKHRRRIHEDAYPHRCLKCGHGMSMRSHLDTHKCGRVRRIRDNRPGTQSVEHRDSGYDEYMVSTEADTVSSHVDMSELSVLPGNTAEQHVGQPDPLANYEQPVWQVCQNVYNYQ